MTDVSARVQSVPVICQRPMDLCCSIVLVRLNMFRLGEDGVIILGRIGFHRTVGRIEPSDIGARNGAGPTRNHQLILSIAAGDMSGSQHHGRRINTETKINIPAGEFAIENSIRRLMRAQKDVFVLDRMGTERPVIVTFHQRLSSCASSFRLHCCGESGCGRPFPHADRGAGDAGRLLMLWPRYVYETMLPMSV